MKKINIRANDDYDGKRWKIGMGIYIEELRCDWYMGSDDFYEGDEITEELIEKIKNSIIANDDDGVYDLYAAYDDGNWLQMQFRFDLVLIEIICEPNHEYSYYDKKYEGRTDLEPIEFGQDLVSRADTCDDMVLAANIFEEWALHGKLYPTTWVDFAEGED